MNREKMLVTMRSALVVAFAAALAGCSGMPEPPFGNPFARLFDTISVAQARDAKVAARTASLTVPNLVSEGVLTVGVRTSVVGAPFCTVEHNPVSNVDTVSGMDVDIASALADELGLAVRFVPVDGVAQALAASQCDIVMDVSADSAEGSTIVGGYYESASSFFHNGIEGVVDVSALNAATVGLQEGSVSEGVLNRTGLVMTERTYANLNDAFDALNAGTVDYVLCDAYPGAFLAAKYADVTFAGTLNAPVSVGIAVAAEKSDTQTAMRQALDAISTNGVMGIIRARWVGGMPSLTATDEIRDVPGAVSAVAAEGEGTPDTASVEGSQDGSTAGSNAVIVTE